jgi:hypothetical protein
MVLSAIAAGPVYAQACKAVSRNGKPFAGAANASI